jgi:protein MpaA
MKKIMECKTKLGNTIELLGEPKENSVLIIGVVHGDEPQGKLLIEKYLQNSKSKQIPSLFIPCLNPDGLALGTRTNANRVDLNRNFPTKNWGQNEGENATCDDETTAYYGGKSPASEIETKFVISVIEKFHPKLILTLHAPYKVVNYDGDAKIYAQQISEIINYPIEESIGYPTPGSFGTWAGVERNIPIITLELDETCPIEELETPVFKIFDLFKEFSN